MSKKLWIAVLLLLIAPALFARDFGLVTYEQFLASKGLTKADVDCINEKTEAVLNTRNQSWDQDRKVCEVWVKEKLAPAQRLTFKDGTQVYKAVHEWQEEVPKAVTTSGEFVVKADEIVSRAVEKKSFKRYVPKTVP